jgi:hypothetical protein
MEAKHKENLLKLARYLWDLPEDYTHFDMEYYFAQGNSTANGVLSAYNDGYEGCGTVACALGHGPAAGIGNGDDLDGLTWDRYSKVFFGARVYEPVWEWCFESRWAEEDNTPRGAAKRIFYMLENGVPKTFEPSATKLGTLDMYDPGIYTDQKRL